jgi:hypothetical protein
MALDDYLESEVAIAVVATSAILSPRVRGVLRRGAVLGLAGLLTAGDMLGSFAGGVMRGAQNAAETTTAAAQNAAATMQGAARAATGAADDDEAATMTPEDTTERLRRARRARTATPAAEEAAANE